MGGVDVAKEQMCSTKRECDHPGGKRSPHGFSQPLQMHNQHGQRIVGAQRFSAGDILQVEGRAVRHPRAGLRRSLTPSGGEERAIRAVNVNLDVCRVWRIPTDRGSSIRRAHERDGVRGCGEG